MSLAAGGAHGPLPAQAQPSPVSGLWAALSLKCGETLSLNASSESDRPVRIPPSYHHLCTHLDRLLLLEVQHLTQT